MAIRELVARVRVAAKSDQAFAKVSLDECVRKILLGEFGVEPTVAEITELADAVLASQLTDGDFFQEWDHEEDAGEKGRQYGRGKEVIRKSEHRAG